MNRQGAKTAKKGEENAKKILKKTLSDLGELCEIVCFVAVCGTEEEIFLAESAKDALKTEAYFIDLHLCVLGELRCVQN